jgi:uncharacterized protein (TIGR03067 family)
VIAMPDAEAVQSNLWIDVQPLLDEELSRLPDKYRGVIILCDLEGKTRQEAARHLDCPEGTVGGRLARARAMLANRLAKRGVTLSGGALAMVMAQSVASGVPIAVVSSTIKAVSLLAAGQAATGVISVKVAALTEGVLKAMLFTKLKIGAVLLALGAMCGVAGLVYRTHATEPRIIQQGQEKPQERTTDENEAAKAAEMRRVEREIILAAHNLKVAEANLEQALADYNLVKEKHEKLFGRKDNDKLQGTWRLITTEFDGLRISEGRPEIKGGRLVIEKSSFTLFSKLFHSPNIPLPPEDVKVVGKWTLDAKKNPREIMLTWENDPWTKKKNVARRGIYVVDGDILKICFSTDEDAKAAPTEFSANFDSKRNLLIFKLDKSRQFPASLVEVRQDEPVVGTKSVRHRSIQFDVRVEMLQPAYVSS